MQNRTLIIVLTVVGIIGAILLVLLLREDSAAPTDATVPADVLSNTDSNGMNNPFPGESGTDLFTTDGSLIRARNFLGDPTTIGDRQATGTYFLGNHKSQGFQDSTADDDVPYVIQYKEATDSFVIALYKEPIGSIREDMQRDLVTRLGIAGPDLCRLKYSVTTPWWVNQVYAGTDLRFSFCPGATELP